jgi:hypothetical protein
LRDFGFLPSPTDGEYNAFLAVFLLKQPLAESFWVFNNLVKILQWILPPAPELKEFSSSPVLICTLTQMPT